MKRVDLTGVRYERLVGVRPVGKSPTGHVLWLCRCDCGNTKELSVSQFGRTRSCGCLASEVTSKRSKTHGMTYSKTHNVWIQMRRRCRERPEYIARGVCERWEKSFEDFLEDMGECPDGMTIERIVNSKGYEPGNCRWATDKEQANNRKTSVLLTYNGRTQSAAEWAEEVGIQAQTIRYRVKNGWSVVNALTTPTK